jgi:hypothetical protein
MRSIIETSAIAPATDPEIRVALEAMLLAEHAHDPATVLMTEVGVCRGQVRVDVLVVNGVLHGFEIKSDRDSLRRLPSQVELYSKVLDRATLVVGDRHFDEARELVPPWWGILRIRRVGGELGLVPMQPPQPNPAPDPRAIAEFLWRDDALALLEARGAARGMRGKPRRVVWDCVCENLRIDEISAAVRDHLRSRAAPPAHQ